VTSSGITWIQRSETVGSGRNPQASVMLSLVKIALANQTPTAIRRNASQRSGDPGVEAEALPPADRLAGRLWAPPLHRAADWLDR